MHASCTASTATPSGTAQSRMTGTATCTATQVTVWCCGSSSPRLCTEQHITDALVFPGACRPCAGGPTTAAAFAPYLAHKAACNEVVLQRYRAESRTVHLPCSRASGETAATQKLDVHPSIACHGLVSGLARINSSECMTSSDCRTHTLWQWRTRIFDVVCLRSCACLLPFQNTAY